MLRQHNVNGLTYFTFPALSDAGVEHLIGTRRGGVSEGPFEALNMSTSVGDAPEKVRENRARLGQLVGITPEEMVTAWLVHGSDVARVNSAHRGQRIPYHDALITNEPNVPLFMTFADCLPIILYDPVHRAVGLVHAGWRGTAAGILLNTIRAMGKAFGTRAADLTVAFGPSIGICHYEVGTDVLEAFRLFGHSPVVMRPGSNGRAHLDLVATNRRQAEQAGVEQVLTSGYCTACHTDLFYSHRAEGGRTGRFGVVVMLRE